MGAALAAGALLLPATPAVVLFALGAVAVFADAWQVRQVPPVTVDAPPVMSRGVAHRIEASTDGGQVRLRLVGNSAISLAQPTEGVGAIATEAVARRRGTHELAPVSTLAVGPLGLGAWHHRAGAPISVTVYPDMPAARQLATDVRLGRFGDSSRRSRGPLGLGTELETIRDYLPDDDIRQVNWKATIRVGHPMSNTYRVEQEREILVLVDCGRLMAAPVQRGSEISRLDAAVDAAAAMAAVADVLGDRVGVLAFDDRLRRRLMPRRGGGDAVVAAIHDLEASGAETNFDLAFRSVAHHKRAFILLLTDILEETASRPLLDAIPILARHHAVTVAGLSDPAVTEALANPASSEAEAFRTAVAIDIENSRRLVTTALEGYGVGVIDAPLRTLAAGCVAAYLRAKRRARL